MSRSRRSLPAFALLAGVLIAATAAGPASASARPAPSHRHHASRPTAAVTLGDSYISGEAGRWLGNSAASTPGHAGTDRAWRPSASDPNGTVDPALVYGTTAGGCDRSDTAEINSAHLPVQRDVNLACSGAVTADVLRASAGGVSFKGEAPQDDQLAAVAKTDDVKLIALSIGGNDIGFSAIVTSCVLAYLSNSTPCSQTQGPALDAKLELMKTRVGAVVDDIRATMAAAGYRTSDYRLIVQSYPSPLPASQDARYSGSAPDARASVGGCPFLDADFTFGAQTLTPSISKALEDVAGSHHAQFLDLVPAFAGHELCAATDQQSTGKPVASSSEWVRFVDLFGQGSTSESLHPNAYGQQAVGRCLLLAAFARRDVSCHGLPDLPTWAMYLTRT
jgi:lysophospholipase L1-like esterase